MSKESNILNNNSAQRNVENNLKGIASTDKTKTNFSKISSTIGTQNPNKPNLTAVVKDPKRHLDKQLTFLKTTTKDHKPIIDANKTIDLTGSIKVSNVITTPQNKQISQKEGNNNHESKPPSAKTNENKGSMAISVKTGIYLLLN
jgi:hypothetical protein